MGIFCDAKYIFDVISCNADREEIVNNIVNPLLPLIEDGNKSILKISGFVKNVSDYKLFKECLYENLYPLPPVTITIQTPLCEKDIQIMYWLIDYGNDVKVNSIGSGVVIIQHRDLDFIHIGGIRFDPPRFGNSKTKEKWLYSYWQYLDSVLLKGGFSGDDIIRLWLYINDITEYENGVENYQLANCVRSRYFNEHEFFKNQKLKIKYFPASTGIGTKDNTFIMHCIACRSRNNSVFSVPMENPLQSRTIDYNEKHGKFRPKFSRGVAVVHHGKSVVFVSGTASIVHSDTAFIGDPEKQCEQTLENIEVLLSKKNFRTLGINVFEEGLKTLAYAKIYLKNRDHLTIIRKICEARLPDIPKVYIEADICRPELLLEIEGTAFTEVEVIKK